MLFPKNDECNQQQSDQQGAKDGQHGDDYHVGIHLSNLRDKPCVIIAASISWKLTEPVTVFYLILRAMNV